MSRSTSIQKWKPFEMMVDTTIAGDSGVGNFRIDKDISSTYRYKVDWGDGSISAITSSSDITHTYPSGGTYTIKISGRFDKLYYQNSNEADKIMSINSWGNIPFKNLIESFRGAANLTGVTTQPPNLKGMTTVTLESMFMGCTNLNVDFITNWDLSGVLHTSNLFRDCTNFNNGGSPSISGLTLTFNPQNINGMFWGCTNFNQPIGNWNVSESLNFGGLFYNASSFNQDISSWVTSACTDMNTMFLGATSFNQPIGNWDVSNVTNMTQMLRGTTTFNQPLSGWSVSNVNNMNGIFLDCNAFNQDISSWDVSNVTDMGAMFYNATNFNQDIGSWTTSACTNMTGMFNGATNFNQDIGNWDVSNVGPMSSFNNGMFQNATSFNNGGSPSISGWTTSACTNMSYMFENADSFNQDISSWDVSNVDGGSGFWSMFRFNSGFNSPVFKITPSNGTVNLFTMFQNATSFNQDVSHWDMTSASLGYTFANGSFNNGGSPNISGWTATTFTNLIGTFSTSSFNQPINSWNVSACTNMSQTFQYTPFNQPLDTWDVSNVQTFQETFRGSPFNQDISMWNVGNATIFGTASPNGGMFQSNTAFNQDISGWNMSKAQTLRSMFNGATSFNQDLGGWVMTAATSMHNMFDNCGLSTSNYNSILTGWTGWNGVTATTQLQPNVVFGASGLNYSSGSTAEDARNHLINTLGWTITDAGGV